MEVGKYIVGDISNQLFRNVKVDYHILFSACVRYKAEDVSVPDIVELSIDSKIWSLRLVEWKWVNI